MNRIDRYKILYSWKSLEKLVPECGIEPYDHARLGRLCDVPVIKRNTSCKLRSQRESSFQISSPTLFNCLPKEIQNLTKCGPDFFKCILDSYLTLIPDEPKIPGLVPAAVTQCAMSTNNLQHQISRARRDGMTAGWSLTAVTAA